MTKSAVDAYVEAVDIARVESLVSELRCVAWRCVAWPSRLHVGCAMGRMLRSEVEVLLALGKAQLTAGCFDDVR